MISSILLAAFALVGADKSAKVVIPENAEPSTRLCVEELTNYVAKISGEILKVEKVGGGGQWRLRNSIIIGNLKTLGSAAPKQAREALEKAKQYEAAWMGTVDGNLWIVGKELPADLYATYHLLETKLGVRWFQAAIPEDPGDYYPTQKTIVIEDFQEFREPDFEYRSFGQMSSHTDKIASNGWECLIRNGFSPSTHVVGIWDTNATDQISRTFRGFYAPRCSPRRLQIGGGHEIFHGLVFPPEKCFKSHPEWFALRNGKRELGSGWQYCISNPELLEMLLQRTLKTYERSGGYGIFTFGYADQMHGYCECDACRALDGPHEGEHGPHCNISSRMLHIANYLTKPILDKYPNATLKAWPYAAYREIPEKGGRYDPRCIQEYCTHGRCFGHAIDDPKCKRNVNMWAEMTKWRKELPRQCTYEYFTCTPALYTCHEKLEQADLKAYKRAGMIGWYNEGLITGSYFVGAGKVVLDDFPSNWQWLYSTGHLLWNTDLDLDALLEDAETKYYGIAAEPMKKYHKLRRELWDSRTECLGYPSGDGRRPFLLMKDGAKEQLLAYLDEAERLVEVESPSRRKEEDVHSPTPTLNSNSILRFRISRDRKWLDKYWIKPNEKARANVANRLMIPFVKGPIAMSGKGDDPAWSKALVVPAKLFRMQGEYEFQRKKPIPDAARAEYRIVTDGDALYFLISANETNFDKLKLFAKKPDDGAWGDDGVEIMIFPPSVENVFYHLAINANGVVYDARCPGEDVKYNLGVTTKTSRSEKGWMLEVRVPSNLLHPIVAGDKWRMQMNRNRYADAQHETSISLGGYLPHDTAEYLTFEFKK